MAKQVDREEFGPNTWLVEELYRQYREDPDSVSETWREFFEDYVPSSGDGRIVQPEARAAESPASSEPPRALEAPEPAAATLSEQGARPPEPKDAVPLTGIPAVIAKRMEESLEVPTATSV